MTITPLCLLTIPVTNIPIKYIHILLIHTHTKIGQADRVQRLQHSIKRNERTEGHGKYVYVPLFGYTNTYNIHIWMLCTCQRVCVYVCVFRKEVERWFLIPLFTFGMFPCFMHQCTYKHTKCTHLHTRTYTNTYPCNNMQILIDMENTMYM